MERSRYRFTAKPCKDGMISAVVAAVQMAGGSSGSGATVEEIITYVMHRLPELNNEPKANNQVKKALRYATEIGLIEQIGYKFCLSPKPRKYKYGKCNYKTGNGTVSRQKLNRKSLYKKDYEDHKKAGVESDESRSESDDHKPDTDKKVLCEQCREKRYKLLRKRGVRAKREPASSGMSKNRRTMSDDSSRSSYDGDLSKSNTEDSEEDVSLDDSEDGDKEYRRGVKRKKQESGRREYPSKRRRKEEVRLDSSDEDSSESEDKCPESTRSKSKHQQDKACLNVHHCVAQVHREPEVSNNQTDTDDRNNPNDNAVSFGQPEPETKGNN